MENKNVIKNLTESSYCIINKELRKIIGRESDAFLMELIGRFFYFNKNNNLTENGEFYCTEKYITKETTLSRATQTRIRKKLKDIGILEINKRGLPAKNFYKINFDKIEEMIKNAPVAQQNHQWTQNDSTSGLKMIQLVDSKRVNLYNNIIDNNRIEDNKIDLLISKDIKLNDSFESSPNEIKNSFNKIEKSIKENSFNEIEKSTKENSFNEKEEINKEEDLKEKEKQAKEKETLPQLLKLYWNTQPNLSKHKDGTKNCTNCRRALIELQKGTFFKKNTIDPKYLKNNKIPKEVLDHKFTRKEIKEIIQNINNFHDKAYFPQNKKGYPKSFISALYNPKPRNYTDGGISLFLRCYYHPPKLIAASFREDKYPEVTEEIIDFINERRKWLNEPNIQLTDLEKNKLVKRTADIVRAFKDIIRNPDRCKYCRECEKHCKNGDNQWMEMKFKLEDDPKDPYGFLCKYFESIRKNSSKLILDSYMLGPRTRTWHMFCNYIFSQYKICLENVRLG